MARARQDELQQRTHGADAHAYLREQLGDERATYLDEMVARGNRAAAEFRELNQEQVDEIVWRMVRAGLLAAGDLAALAIEETGIGVFEDKVLKNYVATEFLYDYVKHKKTVGVIFEDHERALKHVAEPIGTVLAIMPLTNPTATALFKTIIAAKTRNAMIVRPSSKAMRCSAEAVRLVVEAGEAAGMPVGAIQCMQDPTHLDTQYYFSHPDIDFIWTTGGQRIVTAANASGKPTIGVGPGNAPMYLHESCDHEMAVLDLLLSKTFDASVICPAEQTCVVDASIMGKVRDELTRSGARILTLEEAERVIDVCFDRETGAFNHAAIGRSVQEIAGVAGVDIEHFHKLLVAPVERFDTSNLLLHEKLFPVLALIEARDVEHALELCDGIIGISGMGHTSAVYARDEAVIDAFSQRIRTGRILVNSPTAIGALGGMYTDLPPTFSLGCGTWGGSNTTNNVNVDDLLNIKQVSYRKHPPMWFRAPVDVYYNEHAIDNLRQLGGERVAIVTTPGNVARGMVELITHRLEGAVIDIYSRVGPEPTELDVAQITRFFEVFKPDVIVALGGGSVIDVTKVARLQWEHPGVDWTDLALPFLDVRKRVAHYPERRGTQRIVAIPTTSGTGSEVSPVAVITDSTTGRKVTLVDYSLVPEVAIVDPQVAISMSPTMTADTGVDALTHAVESLVSVFASPYTSALSMQAYYELVQWLPAAYLDGSNMEARQRVHNAATIAGLAFSNAFVGVTHSLAHAVGAKFGLAHGRACGIFLPHVIRYNAALPRKTTPSLTSSRYMAPEQYALAARAMGLGSTREHPEVGVDMFYGTTVATLRAVEIPASLEEAGIDETEFRAAMPELVKLAFEDLSGRTNPRMPMLDELEELLLAAWSSEV